MYDFLGQKIEVGDWLVTGSAGARACEYGMILHRVVETSPRLKTVRLTAKYPTFSDKETVAGTRFVYTMNLNKFVVIDPPAKVKNLFCRVQWGTASQEDQNLVGLWLHGQREEPLSWK